jgi:hypothetical protein
MEALLVIRRRLRRALCGLLVMTACSGAHAQEIPGYPTNFDAYDPREVAMLPSFCAHTQLFRVRVPGGDDPAQIARWQSVFGDMFQHLHHYCWGLMKTNRGVLLARSGPVREFYLRDSLQEFDYVIERSPPNFILLPEILTKKGENLVRLGRGPVALMEFERAIELKSDYWPPYAHMSDYYKGMKDVSKAREALDRGLSFSPEAPALKRRLAELGKGAGSSKEGR